MRAFCSGLFFALNFCARLRAALFPASRSLRDRQAGLRHALLWSVQGVQRFLRASAKEGSGHDHIRS